MRTWIAVAAAALLILRLGWYAAPKSPAAPRIAAGELIAAAGRYGSPRSTRIVEISAWPDGRLSYGVETADPRNRQGCRVKETFRAGSGWVAAWDDRERLWMFAPEFSGYCHCLDFNERDGGLCEPGEHGGWDGIPASFLARLPEKAREVQAETSRNSMSMNTSPR